MSTTTGAVNRRTYTREVLSKIVVNNRSIAGVLRDLGLRPAGGTHAHISRRIKEYGLDTSHFTGRASNTGPGHRGGPARRAPLEILVKRNSGRRQLAVRLRRALVEIGVPYKCAKCGLGDTWRGHPLKLQVNHRNHDWLDDRRQNLEFLCPNCHSQTEGWCGSRGGTDHFSDAEQCRKRYRANGGTVDAPDLGSGALRGREGSSPSSRTRATSGSHGA